MISPDKFIDKYQYFLVFQCQTDCHGCHCTN